MDAQWAEVDAYIAAQEDASGIAEVVVDHFTKRGDPPMDTDRWSAVDRWVVEECPEQPEEPQPLFQCDTATNAATVARIHSELVAEVERLIVSSKSALTDLQHVADERDKLAVEVERLTEKIDTQTAEIERLNRDGELLREAVDAWIADRDRLAAVITRVRELCEYWAETGNDPRKSLHIDQGRADFRNHVQAILDGTSSAGERSTPTTLQEALGLTDEQMADRRSKLRESFDRIRDAERAALLDSPSTEEQTP